MTNQKILTNAPEGWTHVSEGETYYQDEENTTLEWVGDIWIYAHNVLPSRSRSDIERIVELESQFRINPVTGEATCPGGLSVGSLSTDHASYMDNNSWDSIAQTVKTIKEGNK